jgi:sec-independent protein translocase protein TatA
LALFLFKRVGNPVDENDVLETEMGAFSLPKLLLLLIIAFLIFGSNKLSTLGKDLGGAIRDFRKALQEDEPATAESSTTVPRVSTPPVPDVETKQPPDSAVG